MPESIAETAADIQAKQVLRQRRFLMSAATYAACVVIAQFGAWLGYVPTWLPMWWGGGATLVNAAIFAALRSGWKLRLRDPSMTELQLHVAMIAAMAFISQTDEARGAFLIFVPVPLLFGILRLNFVQMARVGLVGFGGYVLVVAILLLQQPERVEPGLEAIRLISLAGVMFYMCVMCGYISRIRADLAEAVRKVRELAERDSLTGLWNRRKFMERLEEEIARCDRRLCPGLTLCMLDLDNFKQINDRFGHHVGDEVLVLVGNCLRESIRSVDYVGRYGGEEFVILLEGSSAKLALAICERIRARIERLHHPAVHESCMSISIGVAHFAPPEKSAALLERADRALYLAKTGGRNRVHIAP